MFREGEIKAGTAHASARVASLPLRSSFFPASLPGALVSPIRASRLVLPLLVAEAGVFALVAASGKIPEFLFTAIRALLTF